MASAIEKLSLQKDAHAWEQETFGHTGDNLILKLREEVDELFEAIKSGSPKDIRGEISDVALILMMLSERNKGDLLYDAVYKLEYNRRCKWKQNEDGTYSRIKTQIIKEEPEDDGE